MVVIMKSWQQVSNRKVGYNFKIQEMALEIDFELYLGFLQELLVKMGYITFM